MSLDPREFIRVHSGMPEHPKVEPLSDNAFRALIEAWCLCRRSRNDGLIPLATWNKRWKLKARKELIAAGLAHLHADGVEVHDWLEHQPSAADLEHKRSVRAEAGRKGGKQSGKARQDRSTAQANAEAFASGFASPSDGHETVTFVENVADMGHESGLSKSVANQARSDAVQTELPAETVQNSEAIASVLLDQTLKHSGSKTQPDSDSDIDIGRVGGETYVSSAPVSRENNPPPKHHAEHPEWDPDCAQCTALLDNRIDFQAAQVDATAPPAPHCDEHPGGTDAPCAPCGKARRARHAYDITRARAQSARLTAEAYRTAERRRAAIDRCGLCDATGYHGTTVCDHDPDRPARAARRIAEIRADLTRKRATTTEEHTNA
ncbi:hypothetical protein ACFXHA_45115 [Nocardia sp. NPDC059240]|uniref:hypothetical protein n=1 Tax=Nocardia sp. NPDC059240 TaxID=3346786 RepID=UPI0036B593DF